MLKLKGITKKPIEVRKNRGDMTLNAANLKKFSLMESLKNTYQDKNEDFLQIDEKAKEYLSRNLNIDVNEIAPKLCI